MARSQIVLKLHASLVAAECQAPPDLAEVTFSPGAHQGRQLIPHGPRKALLLGCSPADYGQLLVLDWGMAFLKRARQTSQHLQGH